MTPARLEEPSPGQVQLSGDLTMGSVARAVHAGKRHLAAGKPPTTFDFHGVGRMDSAGLALLLEWRREARRQGSEVHFQGLPAHIQTLATVCGVADLIATSTEGRG